MQFRLRSFGSPHLQGWEPKVNDWKKTEESTAKLRFVVCERLWFLCIFRGSLTVQHFGNVVSYENINARLPLWGQWNWCIPTASFYGSNASAFKPRLVCKTCGHLTSMLPLHMVQKRVVHIGRCNRPRCGRVGSNTTVVKILQKQLAFCPPKTFFPLSIQCFFPGHANIRNGADLRRGRRWLKICWFCYGLWKLHDVRFASHLDQWHGPTV